MNQAKLSVFFVVCDNVRTNGQLAEAVLNGREVVRYCQQNQLSLPSLWLSSPETQVVKAGFATIEGAGRMIDQVLTAPKLSVLVLDQYLLAKAMAGELLLFLDRYLQATTHPPPHFSVFVTTKRAWIEPGVAYLLLPDAVAATRDAVAAKCLEKFAPGIPKRPVIVLSAVADLDTREFNFSGFDRIGAFADEHLDPNLTSNVRLVMVGDQDEGPSAQSGSTFTNGEQDWLDSESEAPAASEDPAESEPPSGFWKKLLQRILPTK